jgi:hypothetical protein
MLLRRFRDLFGAEKRRDALPRVLDDVQKHVPPGALGAKKLFSGGEFRLANKALIKLFVALRCS